MYPPTHLGGRIFITDATKVGKKRLADFRDICENRIVPFWKEVTL